MGLLGCGGASSPDTSPLQVRPATLVLPPITFGDRATGTYTLLNSSPDPLTIRGIGPTNCDCALLNVELPDRPGQPKITANAQGMNLVLAPGERALVQLQVDTARYRSPLTWKSGRIPLILEDGQSAALDWSLEIWAPYWLEPLARNLEEVGIRAQPSTFFLVDGRSEPEFDLLLPEETDGWTLQKTRLSLDPPVRWRVDVTAPQELPEGPFEQTFSLRTSISDGPKLSFRIFGIGVSDLRLSPPRWILRPARGETFLTATLRCHDRYLELDPPVLSFDPPQKDLGTFSVRTLQAGRAWEIQFRLQAEAKNLPKNAIVLVKTNHPEIPLLELPLLFAQPNS